MRSTVDIEVRKIVVPEGRMRPVNAAQLEVLLDSMRKIGLLQPLVVGQVAQGQWPLVDGAHRLAALKKLNGALFFDEGRQGYAPARRDRGESSKVSPG